MEMYFPKECETFVEARDGIILITQRDQDGIESTVQLTIHQFQEIWNREKSLSESARASK
jgi:hypothetical protein